ncbi:mannose/fructose/N-acetylgalactosamine-specific phosphotransferase system component IID [Breznakia sp. PF5-3]|uniref:PTS system mannose/fructose/sorbose family transporter subunit IID n=1 Tax=unclassified Breznakia TaxID=2623764 RepID=UPI0024071DD8|nr:MULTISPECIES: PTS system mannose/fructose/sorbose family transporter subunit IID [unclassified Breznakia]MDF9825739.1 mannose/fructose/N-acetylgalactosamine-specific phosphotransferase system component IID [Breznakia sp. PM6-1]MDF9836085.1 mannose/fructose/N-acetylgalactosamine-specific phosphotransferase system component IID [Breznakia sp. PF5-3]MDF9838304.1 mannose/fructose/N-acetylgalactosamine-specific phosphotransferase system component IID [Breznakia sp. PFB2-8]MDF9860300.1 mannose/fru
MAKLNKKDIRKCYRNWITFALGCQNMERMMAPAFVRMFGLVADKLYDNEEEKIALLQRHTQFFNTEEAMGSIIPGIILGMEEKRAEGEAIPDDLIQSTKTALMGPFAGIGDSLFGGTLRPILCSIAMGLAAEGNVTGPLFYCLAWLGVIVPSTWLLFSRGYKLGMNGTDWIFAGGKKDAITRGANLIGLIVVGAISAQYVVAQSGWSYVSGDMEITFQGILDSIMPCLLPLALTLFAWYLLDKKNLKIGKVFLIFIVIAVVASLSELLVLA